jgi:heme a synthase
MTRLREFLRRGMARLREFVRRVRAEGFTPREFRSICVAALALLGIIVVSGGLVRLTGSGLGCDDWPNCNNSKVFDVSNKHAAIEQINRLFTFLVSIGVALAALAAWYRRPRRRDLLVLGMFMLIGVPAQGIVGAIVVWSKLHPATVQLHFVLSMVLIWAAVIMLVRSRQPDTGRRSAAVVPRIRRRVRLLAVWSSLAVVAGTVVTGAGPHAGQTLKDDLGNCIAGEDAARRFFGKECSINGDALVWATRVHGTIVWITVAIALSLLWHLRRLRHDRAVLDAPLTAWLLTALVQGSVGYIQYANELPVALVAIHLAGATVLTGCTAWLWASTSKVTAPASEMLDTALT